MSNRTHVRQAAVAVLKDEFSNLSVSDNALIKFDAESDQLVVIINSDSLEGDVDLDGGGQKNILLSVQTASTAPNQQDVIDERLARVQDVLMREEFLESAGAVSGSYEGYDFDVDESYAIGVATFTIVIYETGGI